MHDGLRAGGTLYEICFIQAVCEQASELVDPFGLCGTRLLRRAAWLPACCKDVPADSSFSPSCASCSLSFVLLTVIRLFLCRLARHVEEAIQSLPLRVHEGRRAATHQGI